MSPAGCGVLATSWLTNPWPPDHVARCGLTADAENISVTPLAGFGTLIAQQKAALL